MKTYEELTTEILENCKQTFENQGLNSALVYEVGDILNLNAPAPFCAVHFEIGSALNPTLSAFNLDIDLFIAYAGKNITDAKQKSINLAQSVAKGVIEGGLAKVSNLDAVEFLTEFQNKSIVKITLRNTVAV